MSWMTGSPSTAAWSAGSGSGGVKRRRHRQQLVDRRRLVLLFGEPVAVGERLDLVGADPIDQPIEVLANARLGAAAVRRLQQHADRLVELDARALDVTELELPLTGLEMLVGEGDQGEDGIFGRSGRRDRRDDFGLRRLRRDGRLDGPGRRAAGAAARASNEASGTTDARRAGAIRRSVDTRTIRALRDRSSATGRKSPPSAGAPGCHVAGQSTPVASARCRVCRVVWRGGQRPPPGRGAAPRVRLRHPTTQSLSWSTKSNRLSRNEQSCSARRTSPARAGRQRRGALRQARAPPA